MAGQNRFARFILIIFLSLMTITFLAFIARAIDGVLPAEQPANLTGTLACQGTQTCQLFITIVAGEQDVIGTVKADIEGGVRFLNNDLPFAITNNGHSAHSQENVLIPAGEFRTFTLSLIPDKSTRFSGGYLLRLQLEGVGVDLDLYSHQFLVYVYVHEHASVHIIPNRSSFDNLVGDFRPGSNNLAYLIKLDAQTRQKGTMYVLVDGVDNAIVGLMVADGLIFDASGESTAQIAAGLIQPGGYRILPFTFHYAPGSVTGPRRITALLNTGVESNFVEQLPYQIRVNDGSQTGQPFLELIEEAPPSGIFSGPNQ